MSWFVSLLEFRQFYSSPVFYLSTLGAASVFGFGILTSARARDALLLLMSVGLLLWSQVLRPYELALLFAASGVLSWVSRRSTFPRLGILTAIWGVFFVYKYVTLTKAYQFVGLSYIFVKAVQFFVDVRNGKIKEFDSLTLLNHLLFFPSFLAGPIARYQDFERDSKSPAALDENAVYEAFVRFAKGAFQKFALAPIAASWALNPDPNVVGLQVGFMPLFAYSFYIYFDFSGYSDMAIGLARLLGYQLPENFRSPYLKRNLIEFWQSWHISFSNWLRTFVFMPIGQKLFRTRLKSSPTAIAILSYLITFLFCGFWHGAGFHFVLWGVYHGIGLSLCKLYADQTRAFRLGRGRGIFESRVYGVFSIALTFVFVSGGWFFFAQDDATISQLAMKALEVLRREGWMG